MSTQTVPPEIIEHTPPVPPATVKVLGQDAIAGTIPEEYIDDGIKELEDMANRANRRDVEPETYVENVAEAHEAAKAEDTQREIDAVYEAAHEENKQRIQDEINAVYDEAVRENETTYANHKPGETKAQPEQTLQDQTDATTAKDEGKTEATTKQTPNVLAPASEKELRTEAQEVMKYAGVPETDTYISPDSTVTKDSNGTLYIVNDTSATVITPHLGGGKPTVTKYAYDEKAGTLTVTTGTESVISRVDTAKSTDAQQWQTHDEIITLPPALAKRFGIERAVVDTSK